MKIDHVLSIDYFHEDILEQITMLLIVKSTACSKLLIQYNITKLHPPPIFWPKKKCILVFHFIIMSNSIKSDVCYNPPPPQKKTSFSKDFWNDQWQIQGGGVHMATHPLPLKFSK